MMVELKVVREENGFVEYEIVGNEELTSKLMGIMKDEINHHYELLCGEEYAFCWQSANSFIAPNDLDDVDLKSEYERMFRTNLKALVSVQVDDKEQELADAIECSRESFLQEGCKLSINGVEITLSIEEANDLYDRLMLVSVDTIKSNIGVIESIEYLSVNPLGLEGVFKGAKKTAKIITEPVIRNGETSLRTMVCRY